MTPLIGLGLSLLTKLPDIWEDVASIFGKEPPKAIHEAQKLVEEVTDQIIQNKITPEQKIQLEQIFANKEIELRKLALEEKKLEYNDLKNQRKYETSMIESEDPYVRRTRPKILRGLFYVVLGYVICVPALVIFKSPPSHILDFIASIGDNLFLLFGASYLGYTAHRSIFDKRGTKLRDMVSGLIGNGSK